MTAKEKYIRIWTNHIDEFWLVNEVLDAKGDTASCIELYKIKTRLRELIRVAADLEFGEDLPEPPEEKNYVL
jgi:hypothetical protein